MSNKLPSLKEIIEKSPFSRNGIFSLDGILENHDIFLAHLPASHEVNQKEETLEEHLSLVVDYFLKLVDYHNLDHVLDKVIVDLIPDTVNIKVELTEKIKTVFAYSIIYHDFGKVNFLFQQLKI